MDRVVRPHPNPGPWRIASVDFPCRTFSGTSRSTTLPDHVASGCDGHRPRRRLGGTHHTTPEEIPHGERTRTSRTEATEAAVQRGQAGSPRVHPLRDAARRVGDRRLRHGGHGRAPGGARRRHAQGRLDADRDARVQGGQPAHLLLAARLEPGTRHPRVPHQDRHRQRHPSLSVQQVGGERGSEDLGPAPPESEVAQRARLHRR